MKLQKISPNRDIVRFIEYYTRQSATILLKLKYGNVTEEDFRNQPLPDHDIQSGYFLNNTPIVQLKVFNRKVFLKNAAKMLKIDQETFQKHFINSSTNNLIYGPMTCMGWHTNSNHVGLRTYYTYTKGKAIFRYIDENGNIQDDYDEPNKWVVRQFQIDDKDKLWHTIWTEKLRYSFGFVFDE